MTLFWAYPFFWLLNLLHVLAQRGGKKSFAWHFLINGKGFWVSAAQGPIGNSRICDPCIRILHIDCGFQTDYWNHTGITWEVRKNVSFSPSRFLLRWSGHQGFLIPPVTLIILARVKNHYIRRQSRPL